MSIFICEKCGKLDNTALSNNYWLARMTKIQKEKGENPEPRFKSEFSFFEDHVCCSDCCNGIQYHDGSGEITLNPSRDIMNKAHWSKYGEEKLLEWESRGDGSMVNASEFFKRYHTLRTACNYDKHTCVMCEENLICNRDNKEKQEDEEKEK